MIEKSGDLALVARGLGNAPLGRESSWCIKSIKIQSITLNTIDKTTIEYIISTEYYEGSPLGRQ